MYLEFELKGFLDKQKDLSTFQIIVTITFNCFSFLSTTVCQESKVLSNVQDIFSKGAIDKNF